MFANQEEERMPSADPVLLRRAILLKRLGNLTTAEVVPGAQPTHFILFSIGSSAHSLAPIVHLAGNKTEV